MFFFSKLSTGYQKMKFSEINYFASQSKTSEQKSEHEFYTRSSSESSFNNSPSTTNGKKFLNPWKVAWSSVLMFRKNNHHFFRLFFNSHQINGPNVKWTSLEQMEQVYVFWLLNKTIKNLPQGAKSSFKSWNFYYCLGNLDFQFNSG